MKYATQQNQNRNASFEPLEDRRLMSSVQLIDGMLVLQGNSDTPNRLSVTQAGGKLIAQANGEKEHYLFRDVKSIRIIGGQHDDKIHVGKELTIPTFVRSQGGNDRVYTGAASDSVYGGDGRDTLIGNGGDDLLIGNAGSDSIDAGKTDNPEKIAPRKEYGIEITRFVLVDAKTNQELGSLSEGSIVNLAKLPQVNIVAKMSGRPASLKFVYDGNHVRYESQAPYCLAADTNGDYRSWTPTVGGHSISATPFSKAEGEGDCGASKLITFKVINDADAPAFQKGGATPSAVTEPPAEDNTPTPTPTPDPKPQTPTTPEPTPTPEPEPETPNDNAEAPTAVITAMQTTINAGHAVHVNGVSSTLKKGDALGAKYEWDFGDAGSKYNKMTGFNAAHIYDSAGTYTITLKVTNSAGGVDTVSKTVTVNAAARKFVYVSPDGDDSNNGSSQGNAVKTFARAAALVDDNTEVLFERGATYNVNEDMKLTGKNIVVGAYGSGAKPVMKWNGGLDYGAIFTTMGGQDITVRDVAFDSKHAMTSQGYNDGVRAGGENITVRDCTFVKVGYAINTNGFPEGMLAQDNTDTSEDSIGHYFAWVQGSDHVYVGNKVRDAIYSHVLRVGGADRVLIANNDFTNLAATSGIRGTLTLHKGNYVYVTGNKLHDSALGVGPLDGDGNVAGKADRIKWVVIEKNLIDNCKLNVGHGTEHISIRENVMEADGDTAIDVKGYSDQYDRGVVDLYISHNTGINNETGGRFLKVGGDVDGITLTHNLYVAPQFEVGQSVGGAVQVTDCDLNSFREISNNVWPSPTIHEYAQGGINYVGTENDSSGFKTPTEWEGYVQVKNDVFQDVTLTSSYMVTLDGIEAGAHWSK